MIARILAGNDWETITIPRDASASYNKTVWGKGHYRSEETGVLNSRCINAGIVRH
jgi:hypothetical protein